MNINPGKFDFSKIKSEKLILIVLAGIVLVICTVWENKNKETKTDNTIAEKAEITYDAYCEEYIKKQEKRLKEIISKIEGTGDVSVMITIKNTAQNKVLTEKNVSYEDTDNKYTYSEENKTVYVTDSDGNTKPYVLAETLPKIEGVAVIADGAKNSQIKEKIISIVKSLFGIEVNKISVTE